MGIWHAVSSKVQGTVKVRKFKKVRYLNSTRILICNPGLAIGDGLQESARQRDRPVHGARRVSQHEGGGEYHDTSGKSRGKDDR